MTLIQAINISRRNAVLVIFTVLPSVASCVRATFDARCAPSERNDKGTGERVVVTGRQHAGRRAEFAWIVSSGGSYTGGC